MRNLLQFIGKNIHLLLFIALEVVAFLLITHNVAYPRSTTLSAANRIVAGMNEAGDNIVEYFRLRKDNEQLNNEVCLLREQIQLLENQIEKQNEYGLVCDTAQYEYAHLGYRIIPAKVVDITTGQEHNYLTLNKGTRDGLKQGMGVVCGNNVVGVVSRVNEYFALVVPIIHTNINISARVKKNGQLGFTHWEGHNPRYVNLMEIGRHIMVEKGDSVITSGMTATFPEGMMIGIMDKVKLNEGGNYYDIRLRLCTDFRRLRYVQVLNYVYSTELNQLTDEQYD
ncbi:MAG: rod shape-determining protein MreC [Paludibacteraceae bacterium]|nr:rod shape-determining protein MreC [Paludibacteraceae bacterium]